MIVPFRWDWLKPTIQAPYVPTLGVVAPELLSVALFDAVVDAAAHDGFLPYDKDRRWFASKNERVLPGATIHRPDCTRIATLTTGKLLTVHHYSADDPDLDAITQFAGTLAAEYRATGHRVLSFTAHGKAPGARSRLMRQDLDDTYQRDPGPVESLADCEFADTFPVFAGQLGQDGFTFLLQRMRRGHDDGPIMVTTDRRRIVGAIGPLSTLIDASGVRFLAPPYFAVHPACRGQGMGRALWRAAAAWAQGQGAAYHVLQAETGSPAERLYLSEGLRTLGFKHSI
ncbi:MAG TPA: GNAT family N-acetyltransferase [Mycobacteriales bacterium]|nr:GNAT family N-acetyltransferase [Mycobacteriales bacterium]